MVNADGDPSHYGRGADPRHPRFGYTRLADYVSGASIMVDRETWESVGGFDLRYAPAYFEDTDLAFKVRAAGKQVVYAALSQVFHQEGATSGTDVSSGAKRFQEVNRPKFKRAWAETLPAQPPRGLDAHLAAEHRGVDRRALVIDRTTLRPERSAGDYAAVQEIRLLQTLGYKVTLMPEDLRWRESETEYLQRLGVEVLYAPFSASLESVLDERGAELDLVYIHRFDAAERSLPPVRRLAPRATVALQLADLHFLRQAREASVGQGDAEAAVFTREAELDVISRVDLVLSYSAVERAVILSHDLGQPGSRPPRGSSTSRRPCPDPSSAPASRSSAAMAMCPTDTRWSPSAARSCHASASCARV